MMDDLYAEYGLQKSNMQYEDSVKGKKSITKEGYK